MDALRRARSYSSLTVAMPDPSSRASSSAAPRAGNRQTDRQGGRLQDLAPPLGDRAHILLAAPQSPPDGPLRSPRHDRRWLCQAHDDRGHAEAADGGGPLIYRANFRFRLYDLMITSTSMDSFNCRGLGSCANPAAQRTASARGNVPSCSQPVSVTSAVSLTPTVNLPYTRRAGGMWNTMPGRRAV